MPCELCELHKMYLERIIKIQSVQIAHLSSLQGTSNATSRKEDVEINNSIFDIIDYNIEELNVISFIQRIENQYPAKETLVDIINEIIVHKDYNLVYKEKSNIIKYINKENRVVYENIENFSIQICTYIFAHLKPIIENHLINSLDNENENSKENNRVQNIMLLKDSKFAISAITKILKRLE